MCQGQVLWDIKTDEVVYLFTGFQSSRIQDIHGCGYRLRQMPYARSRATSTLRVQRQEFHGKNITVGVGKRKGSIFFPSLIFNSQDTIPPLIDTPTLGLYSWLLFSYVYFCYIFVLHPPLIFHPFPQLAQSIGTVLFTMFQITAFTIMVKWISEESESSIGHCAAVLCCREGLQ